MVSVTTRLMLLLLESRAMSSAVVVSNSAKMNIRYRREVAGGTAGEAPDLTTCRSRTSVNAASGESVLDAHHVAAVVVPITSSVPRYRAVHSTESSEGNLFVSISAPSSSRHAHRVLSSPMTMSNSSTACPVSWVMLNTVSSVETLEYHRLKLSDSVSSLFATRAYTLRTSPGDAASSTATILRADSRTDGTEKDSCMHARPTARTYSGVDVGCVADHRRAATPNRPDVVTSWETLLTVWIWATAAFCFSSASSSSRRTFSSASCSMRRISSSISCSATRRASSSARRRASSILALDAANASLTFFRDTFSSETIVARVCASRSSAL
eukprot:PhM_4_TR15717/c0_g1_i1/m.28633